MTNRPAVGRLSGLHDSGPFLRVCSIERRLPKHLVYMAIDHPKPMRKATMMGAHGPSLRVTTIATFVAALVLMGSVQLFARAQAPAVEPAWRCATSAR